MDNELLTNQQTEAEEAFDNVPDEVLQFMLSNAFEVLINAIQHALSLSDEQKKLLKTGAYTLLIRLKSPDLVYEDFLTAGVDEELAAKMVYAINSEIIERAINISNFYASDPDEQEDDENNTVTLISPEDVKKAPTPEDILASLEERLTKSRVVTPTTRNYNATPSPDSAPAPVKRSVDPYREIPEK